MTYRLYGAPGWGSTLAEAALAWAGEPFEFVNVEGFDKPGPARDRLLQINPLGRIPALEMPGGGTLTESAAIVIHLADTHPRSGLAPAPDDALRAPFLNRLIWFVSAVYPTFTYRDYPERWAPDAKEQLVERVDAFRQSLWQQFEAELGEGPFVLGETASALDAYVAIMTRWYPGRDWIRAHCPKLHALALRAEALPQLAPVIARNFPQ